MKKPVFFLSSTIYDFQDLRSSIKYFLEEQGCEVLASEYNDFKKPLDVHSYQACLDMIKHADYFILLVGSRVGGWYDKENQVSITQREYREAYNFHLEGRIKIINFVRQDIWNLRSDRAELKKYLDSIGTEKELSEKISKHPTKKTNDPEFIINFIDEIGKNQETKDALNGKNEFPSGNWLHIFNSFRDIADVLNPEIFDGIPIDEAIMRRLLLSELQEVMKKSLMKFKDGKAFTPEATIDGFYREHSFPEDLDILNKIEVNSKRIDMLSMLAIFYAGRTVNIPILAKALSSSTFLNFNVEKRNFEETPVFKALVILQQEIDLASKSQSSDVIKILEEVKVNRLGRSEQVVPIKIMSILSILHLLQRWTNIANLTKSILKYLNGEDFAMPAIYRKSPIPYMNTEIEKETVTQKELIEFINN